MIKWINRIVIFNLLISEILTWMHPYSVSGKFTQLHFSQILFLMWILVSGISAFYLLGYLIYHWYKEKFANKYWKLLWLIVLIIGAILKFYGPILYYLIVIELKKTCAQNKLRTS
jgi:hypothetical protein